MRIIIVGGGEVGFAIARRISEEKIDVVMIEHNEQRCRMASEELDIAVINGHGASPKYLLKAGVDDAEILIAVTNSDDVNIATCAVAGKMNPGMRRIARLRRDDLMSHIEEFGSEHFGIDLVINLDNEAARTIINLLDVPTADSILDFAEGKIRLLGFQVQKDAPILGRSLIELAGQYQLKNVLIAAIGREGHVIIPRGDDVIQPDDFLWFIAGQENIEVVSTMVGKSFHPIRRVMINGDTNVAYELAKMLERRDIGCKLIVEDRQRAEDLAEQLDATVVLHGRGIDLSLLREENIGEVSAYISVSSREEDNVLSSMLAAREGVPRVIAMIELRDYAQVITSIGINTIVSKNNSAVSAILGMIRKGMILSTSLLGSDAEVIEYKALETSEIVEKPLKDVRFPRGALLGAIVRNGDVIIPSGNDQVQPGDRICVFTSKKALKKVEKLTTVGLGYF